MVGWFVGQLVSQSVRCIYDQLMSIVSSYYCCPVFVVLPLLSPLTCCKLSSCYIVCALIY